MALFLREESQPSLELLLVQDGDGKDADAAMMASPSAGKTVQEGGRRPREPVGRGLEETGRIGT